MTNGNSHLKPNLGQVWTPQIIAAEMVADALKASPNARNMLDPACGPATFSIALHSTGETRKIRISCYDVDERMVRATIKKNKELGLAGTVILRDYLSDNSLEGKYDLIVMNPPYIRQELIQKKQKDIYHNYLSGSLKEKINKQSNLFVLFMLKGILDLAPGGILSAIVYDAIAHTSYGKSAQRIIDRHTELISVKSVKAPFDGVLVDAKVILCRKRKDTFNPSQPIATVIDNGMVMLNELLHTRRGTALPLRNPYIALPGDPYYRRSSPFLIKQSKHDGLTMNPNKRAYLLGEKKKVSAEFLSWLENRIIAHNIPKNRATINPVTGPIAFNYYIRNAPRHLWSEGNIAISDNFYVSTPLHGFPSEVAWLLMNSDLYINCFVSAARNQGSGLLKLQLFEYKQAVVPDWRVLSESKIRYLSKVAHNLITNGAAYDTVRKAANKLTKGWNYE